MLWKRRVYDVRKEHLQRLPDSKTLEVGKNILRESKVVEIENEECQSIRKLTFSASWKEKNNLIMMTI